MDWDPDADFVRIPRPRSVLRVLADLVALRFRRSVARERGATIVDAARVLSASGRAGQVCSRDDAGGEWSVTLGPSEACLEPPEAA
ncbi:hypothetical protein L3Q65_00635 (plasmid) [Amycolatopsis sp. FU40]|uniref:hypothetical protein n=1 Tax=Amycolatopsis sp. FU40 TaxID=2914159 RepID=UPI001F16B99F|nr:hypothetical protein [Amycolatopsis sp. FU40]UKD50835.1 hypothetical protein L3Q65_00635 [Amycolatopsis sp. FU40]